MNTGKVVAIITSAAADVFSTMLGLAVERRTHAVELEASESFDGVVALVGLTGSWSGAARVSCSAGLACKLSGAMLGVEYPAVNEDVLDAMGEVANMIIGNVKSTLEEDLGPMGLSIPTVIFGRNYRARSAGVRDWVVTRFDCDSEILEIRFALMPESKPETARPPAALQYA